MMITSQSNRLKEKKLIEEAKKQQRANRLENYTYRVRGPPDQLRIRKIKKN